ncbi:hypothetical protein ABZU32_20360 [Sphaerisporangium sp. NPDC005288]|uniref:hypothetical protein n=1 Tax=Sphaerisporangium sp. NPDC005288 TaxID=3155114 RepID=UPI0033ADBFAD
MAPTIDETLTGWRVFTSDAGRYWASRERRFSRVAEEAGCWRTVDGDDLLDVVARVAAQEALGRMAPHL